MARIPILILAPPIKDSRDFATQKVGAFWLDKGTGQAGQGLALGVIDPLSFAVAAQVSDWFTKNNSCGSLSPWRVRCLKHFIYSTAERVNDFETVAFGL